MNASQTMAHPPSWTRKWWVALRAFALPASTTPVVFGTLAAVSVGGATFKGTLFLASFLGMALLHTGANLLNDAGDFRKGIDRMVNPVSGSVVRGWIRPAEAVAAGWLFLAAGSLLGVYIVLQVGLAVLWIGLLGIAVGITYTWGPYPLKFHAVGDPAVFFNFGILGSLGAWTVQTGTPSWTPVFWAVPMSLLVVGILHANNWRDIRSDTRGRIQTLATALGDRNSQIYYAFLLLAPFGVILLLLVLSRAVGLGTPMPYSFLITLAALPEAMKLLRKARRRHAPQHPLDFVALDGATARLSLHFGLLCSAALVIGALLGRL